LNPKKICLIISPSSFLLDERVFMSLGILKVAAVLEQTGVKVEMMDLSGIENYAEAIKDYGKNSDTDIFGITATTPQMPAAKNITDAIRSVKPDAKIILGGPHITLVNAAYKREKLLGIDGRATVAMKKLENLFDTLVAGDGEEAIFLACDSQSPKLIDADDPKTPLFLTDKKLTELPFPARHLVDFNSYHYSLEGIRATSIIAQLGCPFACGFCGGRESPMLRRIRMRTSENIVEELIHIYKNYGVRGFMFYDDELNVNKQMIELMNLISDKQKELNVEWRLRGFIKAQLFNDAQAEAIYRAGFRWILVGFESGAPKILQNINKQATREENTRCMEIAKRHGLKVKALMSIGHPGETQETIKDTFNWLLEVKPEDFDVTIITCYPGSPYYDYAVPDARKNGVWVYTYEKTGDKLYQLEVDYTEVADYYKGDPDGGYKAYVYTNELSAENLIQARDNMEREVRRILDIPFASSAPAIRYEHSMGQFGKLPPYIFKSTIQNLFH